MTNKLNFPIKTTILISSPGLPYMIYWTKKYYWHDIEEILLLIGPSFRKQTFSKILFSTWKICSYELCYLVTCVKLCNLPNLTSLGYFRRELTVAIVCWHIPFFAVAVLQVMGSYAMVIFKSLFMASLVNLSHLT